VNFGGCLCKSCLLAYEDYAHRFEAIQRTLVCHFEDMGLTPQADDYDSTWWVDVGDHQFNITDMAVEINEAIGPPVVDPPPDGGILVRTR
jgi:hypothetical protein